jgi:hypothetical protein
MERRYLFAAIAAFALTALCLSYFDIGLSFSERYIWWDSLEHVLGGVTVGFYFSWINCCLAILAPKMDGHSSPHFWWYRTLDCGISGY